MEHQLDKEKIHAISSETRTKILKALQERRKTLSELSAELGFAASTMSEHMEVLVNSGLVKKAEEGHKWKYYELTFLGKSLGSPDVKWYLMFGFFAVFIASGFFWILGYYSKMPLYFQDSIRAVAAAGEAKSAAELFQPNMPAPVFIKPAFPYIAVVLIIIGIIGFLWVKFIYEKKTKKIKKAKSK